MLHQCCHSKGLIVCKISIIFFRHIIPIIPDSIWDRIYRDIIAMRYIGRNALQKGTWIFPIAHDLCHSGCYTTRNSVVLTIIFWTEIIEWGILAPFYSTEQRGYRRIRASLSLHGCLHILHRCSIAFLHRLDSGFVGCQEALEVYWQVVGIERTLITITYDGWHAVISTHNGIARAVIEVENIIRCGLLWRDSSTRPCFSLLNVLLADTSSQCSSLLLRYLLSLHEITRTSKGFCYSQKEE